MTEQVLRLLLVDDEFSVREPLAKHLRQVYQYEVDTAADAQAALDWLGQVRGNYDVALIDDLLTPAPGQDPEPLGVTLTTEIKARYPQIEVIIFTGWGMKSGLEALRAGAYRYLAKPLNLEELGMLIQTGAEHSRLKSAAREKQLLEQLMATSTALLSGRSLPEVLEVILRGVQAIGFDRVGLYLLSEDRRMMKGEAQVDIGTEFVGHTRSVAADQQMQIMLADPRPRVFEREDGQLLPYERELAREGVNQWACVPLILQGEVIGKLSIDNKNSQRPIAEAELRPLALFAAQAAAAIEQTRLRDKEREATQTAERRACNLQAIQEVSTAINSLLELDKILEATCRAAVELFGVEHSGMVLFEEPDRERGWVMAEYPALGTLGLEIPVRGVRAEEDLIQSQEPLVLGDISREPTLGPVQDIFRQFNICSILIVPVVNKGRVVGSFSLEGVGYSRPFTDEEIEQCRIFAAQVAVAVENARLYKDVALERDRSDWLAEQLLALYQITQEIQSELDLPNLLNLISRLAAELLGADAGGILLLDDEKEHLTFKGAYGLSQKAVEGTRDVVGSSIAGRVVKTGEPIIANDVTNDSRFYNPAADGEGWLAIMSTPLQVGGKIIGTLDVHSKRDRHVFDKDDLQILSLMANQAAIAIENVRLFQQTSHRALALETLHRTSLDITSRRQMPELVRAILERAVELLQAKGGGLYLLEESGRRVKVVALSHLPEDFVGTDLGVEEGVVGQVIATKTPQAVSNYRDWPQRLRQYDSYNFTAVAGVPITWEDKIWGVLIVHDTVKGRAFGQEDLDLLAHFGNLAAVAVENAALTSRDADKLRRLARLSQASSEMMGSLGTMPLDERLNLITRHAAEILEAEACAIFLVKRPEFLSLEASYGHRAGCFEKGKAFAICSGPGSGLTGHIASDGKLFNAYGDRLTGHFARREEEARHTPSELGYSVLAIPLKQRGEHQDKLIGLLKADNKKDRTGQAGPTVGFTQEDEWILQLFADAVVVAIEGAELFQAAEAARKRIRSFYEASNALVSSRDPELVLQDIVEQVYTATNACGASMVLIDQMGEVRKLVTAGVNKRFDLNNMVRSDGLSMQIMHTGQIEVIEDTRQQRDRVNPSVFERGIGAALGLPVSLEDKIIGVMWLDYDQPCHFSEDEIDSMRLYVNQATLAYDSARRIKELDHMRQAAEALAGVAGLQEVLEQITHSARGVLQADSAAIWSYDPVQDRFNLERSVAAGIPMGRWKEFQKVGPRQGGTAFTIMERGWVGVTDINDVQRYGFLGGPTSKLLKQIGTRSFQGIALTVGEEKLGILYVNYNHRRNFSEKEQEIAQIFANHAALVLRNAKLLDQVSKAHDAARVVAEVMVLEDLQSTLNSIVQGTRDVLDCDLVTLYTYDQDWDEVGFPPAMIGVNYPEKVLELGKVTRQSLIYGILAQDDLYKTKNATTNPLTDSPFAKREKIVSSKGLPLVAGDRKVGVMFVNYRRPHLFTQDELTNIELFANQAAVAIRNAQLYERLQKRARALETLYEAGRAVTSSLNSEEILWVIAEQSWRLIDTSRFSNLAVMVENNLKSVASYPPEHFSGIQKVIANIDLNGAEPIGVMGRAVKTGQTRLIGDITGDNDYIKYDPDTLSELAVPIKRGVEIMGVINVEASERNAFDEEDQRTLESLAAQAAIAVENARLFEQTRRRTRLLDAAAQVARGATAILDIDKLLHETVRLIVERFDCYHAAVFLLDNEGEYAILRATYPKDDQRMLKPDHMLRVAQEGIVGYVAGAGRPHFAPDVSKDSYYIPNMPLTQAEMAFPLIAREQVIGVLDVQSIKAGDWWAEDIATLQTMADQLANAIHNAQLYQQLAERLVEVNTLQHVAVSLAGALELDEVLSLIMSGAMKLTNTPGVSVLLWDAQQEKFTQGLRIDEGGTLYPYEIKARSKGGLARKILDERKSVAIFDAQQVSDFNPAFLDQGYRSSLGAPLVCQDEAIGVLYVHDREPRQFHGGQIIFLEALASQAAVAIDRARQYEELKKTYEELKRTKGLVGTRTALAWMGMATSTWRHAIDKHALTIREQVQLLAKNLEEINSSNQYPKLNERLATIERLAGKILEKPLTPPLTAEEGVESVTINDLIGERAKQLWQNEPYKTARLKIDLQLSGAATVKISREWLRRAFDILVDNAVDAVTQRDRREVVIGTQAANAGVEIFIADTGPGLSPQVQEKIGLEVIEKPEDARGLGMGLLMAQTIVQTYGGQLQVGSTGPTGTVMIIWLPLENVGVAHDKRSQI